MGGRFFFVQVEWKQLFPEGFNLFPEVQIGLKVAYCIAVCLHAYSLGFQNDLT